VGRIRPKILLEGHKSVYLSLSLRARAHTHIKELAIICYSWALPCTELY